SSFTLFPYTTLFRSNPDTSASSSAMEMRNMQNQSSFFDLSRAEIAKRWNIDNEPHLELVPVAVFLSSVECQLGSHEPPSQEVWRSEEHTPELQSRFN